MDSSRTTRWYHDFFGADFWLSAPDVGERGRREVDYLRRVLEELNVGRRVLEVACGVGVRAVGLASYGYDVDALDPSESALETARRRAEEAGVAVRWHHVDPLTDQGWPTGRVDAAVCIACVGWGSDADQRRLFRRLRRLLAPGGVLVVERVAPWLPDVDLEPDPVSGRARETHEPTGLAFDLRVYSTVELCGLVRGAGFRIQRVDAERTRGRRVGDGGRSAAIVARAVPTPPRALAIATWRTPSAARLDLRYAPDEADLLEPAPADIWTSLVLARRDGGAAIVGGYAVDDPYGGERGAVVVSGHFGSPVTAGQVTFGSGVTSLLHALVGLADGGTILASELVHGDLEAWATADGSDARLVPETAGARAWLDVLEADAPALVHLDRPTFTGRLLSLPEIEELSRAAARVGSAVVVDESAAQYLGPSHSAATVVPAVDNLVVLRGFTKAYSLGGLRAAFAVASDAIAPRVRELVPPLQASELALHAALRLLAAGDVFGRLRKRVLAVKPSVVDLLREAGLDVFEGEPILPWVAVADPGGAATQTLDRLGICALAPGPRPGRGGASCDVLRVTVPLAPARVELLEELLRGRAAGAVDLDRNRDGGTPRV